MRSVPVPAVRTAGWARTPVDAFVLTRLEARGLAPAGPADRRTLLRRAYFDLTGLPPTPAEVKAFVGERREIDGRTLGELIEERTKDYPDEFFKNLPKSDQIDEVVYGIRRRALK